MELCRYHTLRSTLRSGEVEHYQEDPEFHHAGSELPTMHAAKNKRMDHTH